MTPKAPGAIPYGSSVPTALHVAMEMFAASAGIKLPHVPFRGAPCTDRLAQRHGAGDGVGAGDAEQQVDDGKMRAGGWGAERSQFPDLPTFRELGYKDVEFIFGPGCSADCAAGADHDAAARGDGTGRESPE
jgi:tripartite-type tricarboxylate transporter receptor subunit TctC